MRGWGRGERRQSDVSACSRAKRKNRNNVSPIVQTANVLPPCNLLPVDDEDELHFETISEECQ